MQDNTKVIDSSPSANNPIGSRFLNAFKGPNAGKNLVLFLACLSGAMPFIWGGSILPFHDEPGHMALVHILDQINNSETGYAHRYKIELGLTPNWLYYVLVLGLSQIVHVEIAHRLFCIIFAVLALPAAMFYLLHVSKKETAYAASACIFTFHWGMIYGFTQWAAAIPFVLLFVALRLHRYELQTQKSQRIADVLLCCSGFFLFSIHTFAFLVFIPGILIVMAFKSRQRKHFVSDGFTLLPGVMVFFYWLSQRKMGKGGGIGFQEKIVQLSQEYFDKIRSIETNINEFEKFSIGFSKLGIHDVGYQTLLWFTAGLLVLMVLTKWQQGKMGLRDQESWLRFSLATVFCLGYFIVPFYIVKPLNWWGISPRLIPLGFCFLLLATAPRPSFQTPWLPVLFGIVTCYHHYAITKEFRRFNRVEMAGYEEVLKELPSSQRVLPIISHHSPKYRVSPYPHLGSYALIRKNAEIPHGMVHNQDYWVKWNNRFPHIGWGDPRRVKKSMLKHYDYFLVRSPHKKKRWTQFGNVSRKSVSKIIEKGDWALWRVKKSKK